MRFTLGKDKKLKSRKAIEKLFGSGSSIRKGSLRCVYQLSSDIQEHQIAVSVSKRNFKKAPDRNRIKRLIREAYRLHQHELITDDDTKFQIMFLYQSKRLPDYIIIEQLMQNIIKELNKTQHK